MREELIQFEVAKLAKEKGFDLKVDSLYSEYSENLTIIDNSYLKEHNKFSKNEYIKTKNWNESKNYTSAPTQSLLQRWLREVHNIHIDIRWIDDDDDDNEENLTWAFQLVTLKIFGDYELGGYKTYEEALEIGLQEALKLIK